jgi:hypothetical protein
MKNAPDVASITIAFLAIVARNNFVAAIADPMGFPS